VAVAAATDPGALARGRRVAVMAGCHQCHGENLTGMLFHDEHEVVRAWGPNLTLAAAQQSDAELDRAIRHGVAADGRSPWIMPSEAFAALNDSEMADLLAYLRSFPKAGAPQPRLEVGPSAGWASCSASSTPRPRSWPRKLRWLPWTWGRSTPWADPWPAAAWSATAAT
jgi:mono/diheme cytochrome c family protein